VREEKEKSGDKEGVSNSRGYISLEIGVRGKSWLAEGKAKQTRAKNSYAYVKIKFLIVSRKRRRRKMVGKCLESGTPRGTRAGWVEVEQEDAILAPGGMLRRFFIAFLWLRYE